MKAPLRRAARTVALGALITTAATAVVIALEVLAARVHRYAPALGPQMRGTFGEPGDPGLHLVMLGDAAAAGVGVDRVEDTVGGQLGELLAATGRHVTLTSVAVTGTRCADLATQVSRALLGTRPDVAVILVGTNDVTRLGRPTTASAHLAEAVRRLTRAGVAVVVGTCPELGAARALGHPLREIVSWLGHRMANAQQVAVWESGGVPVELAGRVGTVFRADPGTLCPDGFHPSADGYRLWVHALYPAVSSASRVIS